MKNRAEKTRWSLTPGVKGTQVALILLCLLPDGFNRGQQKTSSAMMQGPGAVGTGDRTDSGRAAERCGFLQEGCDLLYPCEVSREKAF